MDKVASLVHLVVDDKVKVLTPLRQEVIEFDMPAKTREIYNEMKRHMIADDVEAANQAVKSGKLRQLASFFIYQNSELGETGELRTRNFYPDNPRRDVAIQWCSDLGGRTGIIFYEYVAQYETLRCAMPAATNNIDNFIKGSAKILLAQINSMSHGLDGLQHVCCDVLNYHPFWSADANAQGPIGRVWRQGQTKPVTVTTLVCTDTLDELVMARVEDRGKWMELFKQHLEKE